ncbi:hypothetical protein NSA28_07345 [Clostridium perfringens]|uniref:hypothetical protein n=1 Tax=Clostridium perfringens TaxID=1502 RepID=UPI001937BB9F|nr:hypothetical protein [Clostridium perfringens]MCR1963432.1 hypothetical protein [Clostridium perfringens]QPR52262.1 hypothetical protein I6G88_04430 [Clostridium perfringens]
MPVQLAEVMVLLHPILAVETGGTNCDNDFTLLAIYQEYGGEKGTYLTEDGF